MSSAEVIIAAVGGAGCLALVVAIFWLMRPLPKPDTKHELHSLAEWRDRRDQRERATGYRAMGREPMTAAWSPDLCTRCGVMVNNTDMHDAFHERAEA